MTEGWDAQKTQGDRVLALHNMARATGLSVEDTLHRYGSIGVEPWEMRRFEAELGHYKIERGLLDFSDMLDCRSSTGVEVLIVDEAQDLSPAQWAFVDNSLADNAERIYLAGDDDQAIYAWNGADATELQRRGRNSFRVLDQSWRVPARVHRFAAKIVDRIRERVPKDWHARSEMGGVRRVGHLDYLPILETGGSWLLLARNTYLLQRYTQWLRREGLIFATHSGSSVKPAHATAIAEWERMRRGQDADAGLALDWSKTMTEVPQGDLPPWFEALDRIPLADREYYRAAMRRGQKLLGHPRITVSTIHGVKGGEADHVALLSDMAFKSYETQDSDDEQRVWYVGVTRAREALYLIDGETPWTYGWPF